MPLAERIETITYDNGKEFASHAEIVATLGAKSYFAKPYHSWERGLNEHTNGLVQGNCISKEREEFDEIILIPGGFFEFSA